MKTLLLMRHAKSSWKDSKLTDLDRPLNHRGQKDALLMGAALLEKELIPQKIVASPAVRARETVAGVIKSSKYTGETEFVDAIYLAEPDTYITVLNVLPDSLERVLLVGHNPGMEGLVLKLSGRIESIEAGTVAHLSLPIQSWGELTSETNGDLVELLHMHDLRDEKVDKKKDKKDEKKHKAEKAAAEKKQKALAAKQLKAEKAAAAKQLKAEKAAAAKKQKEERAAAEKQHKIEKAALALLQKKEKAAKAAAEKQRKEEKAAAALRLKAEQAAEAKKRKEEKAKAALQQKEQKAATEKKHKEEKAAHTKKQKEEKAALAKKKTTPSEAHKK